MDLTYELETARWIAEEASKLLEIPRQVPLQIHRKLGDEPVTNMDIAINQWILENLAKYFPRDPILSEEIPDDGQRRLAPRVWMIDPIDGTRDFMHGRPGYAVMIGFCIDGEPRVGAVSQPATGMTWCGGRGLGAWKTIRHGQAVPIHVSDIRETSQLRMVSSRSHRENFTGQMKSALGITDEIQIGSVGIKLGLIAEGSRDLYVYPGSQTKLWDTCAPSAILTGAGGKVTDRTGQPLCYTGEDLGNTRGVVASNGWAHEAILEAVSRLLPSPRP